MKETIISFLWLFRVLNTFVKVQPAITIFIIVMQTLSKLIHIIAFLLPIKVLLLVGSDGIPKYFKFFIDDEHKLEWAIGLGIASVVFYIATLIIDAINKRLILAGGKQILLFGNELMTFENQEERAKNYYEKINNIFTLVLFIVLTSLILVVLNIKIAVSFFFGTLFFIIITSLILSYKNNKPHLALYVPENVMSQWIVENQKNYVSVISTIIFLLCFGVILAPYFYGEGENLIFSLISLILIRQSTGSGKQLVNKIVSANKNKMDINSIVFVEHAKENISGHNSLSFVEKFNNKSRGEIFKNNFPKELLQDESEIISSWSEASKAKVKIFDIEVRNKQGKKFYKYYIYKKVAKHLYEREQTLFKYIGREELKAPEQISNFEIDTYQCQIVGSELGVNPTNNEWKEAQFDWFIYFAKIRPPVDLVKVFRKSEQLLHQRIKKSAIASIELAVTNNEDEEAFETFMAKLAMIKKKIRKMPLYIYNKELNPDNICWRNVKKSDITVLSWKQWTLAPVGAGLGIHEEGYEDDKFEVFLKHLAEFREKNKGDIIKKENIILMSHMWDLEKKIKNEKYVEALELIKKINEIL